jgi:hypothetical protein
MRCTASSTVPEKPTTYTAYFAGAFELQAEAVCKALEALGFDPGNRPRRMELYPSNDPGYGLPPREYWHVVVSCVPEDSQVADNVFRSMVALMGGEFEAPSWELTPEELAAIKAAHDAERGDEPEWLEGVEDEWERRMLATA